MARVSVRVFGDKELMRQFEAMADAAAGDLLENAVHAGAELVEQEAKLRARKRTGALQESIHKETAYKRKFQAAVDVGPGPEGWYGRLLEFGFRSFAADPWLRPAFDHKRRAAKAVIAQRIKDLILRAVRL